MTAEFEEKEYESPLIHQLMFDSNNMWSPGQVFEGNFGIDSAMEVLRTDFWNHTGYPYYPKGVILSDYNFGYIWKKLNRKRNLPDYGLNLFLQVKRPEGLVRRPENLRKLGLESPYWRFWVKKHQQDLLLQLAKKLNNRAFVAYACSAFHLNKDLYYHIKNNSLIQNSTFIRAENLNNHSKWVYHEPGSNGIACSEPESFREENLLNTIYSFTENYESNQEFADKNLLILRNSISDISTKLSKENPIAFEILERENIINEMRINNASKNFLSVLNFSKLTNSNWISLG